ncbi:MAG TPA: hypothetical protein VGM24_12250 [Puia sp.]|jgi:hypothetical protein
MKYAPYIGILAVIVLILSCFMSWAYYPDINQTFTGFYSNQNIYGKPGRAFVFLAVCICILFLIPKLWAKRISQFLGILILAYAIKSFILFTSCYNGICPVKKTGVFLMLISSLFILLAGLFTGVRLPDESKNQ